MSYYLAKTEPGTYSIDDLQRDRYTSWDGVTNAQAVRAILAMQPGDKVLIYHSGGVSSIVGWAKVREGGMADPANPRSAVAGLEFGGKIDPPVTLADVKTSHLFDDFALVRQSRLSTMPVPEQFIAWLKKLRPHTGL
jgi:predicted RNA-binding protein with PUA-like domain